MSDALLTFVHLSDTHIPTDLNYQTHYATIPPHEGAQLLVEQVNALPFTPDFILHTGDVAYDPHPEAYGVCKEILSKLQAPVYYVVGNHDSTAALQLEMMAQNSLLKQLHYMKEINGVQLVVVDSNGPTPPPAGYMTQQQLDWLHEICTADDDRPLIIATHHNPIPTGIPWLDEYMGIQNGEQFHQAILPARDRIRGVFFGHVHQNLDIYRDGILYTSVLSSWTQFHAYPGQPADQTIIDKDAEPGFNVVTISKDQTLIRRHRFPIP